MTFRRAFWLEILLLVLVLMSTGCGGANEQGRVARLVYQTTDGKTWIRYAGEATSQSWRLDKGWEISSPVVSSNGRRVAFSKRRENGKEGRLCVTSPGDGDCDILVANADPALWSPDGRYLLATQGTKRLILINVRERTLRTVAKGELSGFSFSPNSDKVVYSLRDQPKTSRFMEVGYNLFVTSTAGSKTSRLTDDGISIGPVWGRRGIAFSRMARRSHSNWPHYELWLMRADGGGDRRIDFGQQTELPNFGLISVAWSADGNRLLTRMEEHENSEPYAVDLTRKRVWRIARGSFIDILDISSDGRSVLVVRNGFDWTPPPQVEIVPFAGGKPRIIAKNAWSPSWNR